MLVENFRMAFAAVRTARFRSFLTMLGIIIGVASVITTVSLGEGIKRQISGQAGGASTDLLVIRPGKLVERNSKGDISGINLLAFLSSGSLTDKDVETIREQENIDIAVPFSVVGGSPMLDGRTMDDGFIMATTHQMPEVIDQEVEYGDFFDSDESKRKVAIIGQGVAEKLFRENVPISKNMLIRGHEFVVGGVLERAPANPLNPEADFNNGVFIPFDVGKEIAKTDLDIYEVLAKPKVDEPKQIEQTVAGITQGLRSNHDQIDDFTVLKQADILSVADNLLDMITKTVTLMATVTLIVGGIGIMNVMLVSVTERTREIGIRKAVGATNQQIQIQFLIEAIVISLWGAFLGIVLSGIINLLFRVTTSLEPIINWQILIASAGVAIVIGIIFGLIPAVKASLKDPIEALRTF